MKRAERNNYTPSKNPWDANPSSILSVPKNRRHLRFGGLRKVLECNGIIDENPPDRHENVDKEAREFLNTIDAIAAEQLRHTQLEQEIKEYCLPVDVAEELSVENVKERIELLRRLNRVISSVLSNKEMLQKAIESCANDQEVLNADSMAPGEAQLVVEQADYDEFCKYIVNLNKLLRSRAMDLENIRWAQNSKELKKKWKIVEAYVASVLCDSKRS